MKKLLLFLITPLLAFSCSKDKDDYIVGQHLCNYNYTWLINDDRTTCSDGQMWAITLIHDAGVIGGGYKDNGYRYVYAHGYYADFMLTGNELRMRYSSDGDTISTTCMIAHESKDSIILNNGEILVIDCSYSIKRVSTPLTLYNIKPESSYPKW